MTLEVSKYETLIDIKDSHPENIFSMTNADEVLKLETSTDVNNLQPESKEEKSVTFEVSKLDNINVF